MEILGCWRDVERVNGRGRKMDVRFRDGLAVNKFGLVWTCVASAQTATTKG